MFDKTQNLSNLKDIHMPQDISLFPLALGWWLVLGLFIILLSLPFIIKTVHKIYALSIRRNGIKEVSLLEKNYYQEQDTQKTAASISRLLKRIALIKYEKEFIAGLHSKTWADFLVRTGFNNQKIAMFIGNAAYIDKNNFNKKGYNLDKDIFEITKKWIKQNS